MKQKKGKPSREAQTKHERLLYKLQLEVQAKRRQISNLIGSIEKDYFIKYSKMIEDTDPEANDYTQLKKHINKLLVAWNINHD